MDQAEIRQRIASFLVNNRNLHALHVSSRASLQGPPPSEFFVARLQKLLSAISYMDAVAVIETQSGRYAVEYGDWHEPGEFGIYSLEGDGLRGRLTREDVMRFFVPLGGHVTSASLKPMLDGTMYNSAEGDTVVTYWPPRFALNYGRYLS